MHGNINNCAQKLNVRFPRGLLPVGSKFRRFHRARRQAKKTQFTKVEVLPVKLPASVFSNVAEIFASYWMTGHVAIKFHFPADM